MTEMTTTSRQTIRLSAKDVPSYLRRYAAEVDAWAREAGGRPVLETGAFPAI
jgi:hypothetical protein